MATTLYRVYTTTGGRYGLANGRSNREWSFNVSPMFVPLNPLPTPPAQILQYEEPALDRYNSINLSFNGLVEHIERYKVKDIDLHNEGFPFAYGDKAAYIQQQYGPVPDYLSKRHPTDNFLQRICSRCSDPFYVNQFGTYRDVNDCSYHWGKLKYIDDTMIGPKLYSCCAEPKNSTGCAIATQHVWGGHQIGYNGPLDNFVRTQPRPVAQPKTIYALDCEMCFTGNGLEVTKVSVVRADGRLVYDRYIRPASPIVDYNTRFSGITSVNLNPKYNAAVSTLPKVQEELLEFIYEDTILVGHALHNDLRALKIVHNSVVDTSILFKYALHRPGKPGLKDLAATVLKQNIQQSNRGHSSYEDCRTCMDLVLKRVEDDLRSENQQKLKEQRYRLNPNASEFYINKSY